MRIDRLEATGLGLSLGGHAALLAMLALGIFAVNRPQLVAPPIQVEIVSDKVGLTSTTPEPAPTPPAPRVTPDQGPPEDAGPPEPERIAPRPPTPPEPIAARPPPSKVVSVARPTPSPKPSPAARAQPAPRSAPATKPAPAAPGSDRPRRRPGFDRSLIAGLRDTPGAAMRTPSNATTAAPSAPVGAAQIAGLAAAIRRQVQPCADRIVSPGPGAERITTKLNLQMRADGSFAAAPRVVSQITDADNARYGARVGELARAAFIQCAPFELPPALYDGWKNINLNYKLPE